MQTVTLKLKIEEINAVLAALGNMPYIQVHELIGRIQAQAGAQLQESKNGQATPKTRKEKAASAAAK